nr:DUF935 family protein [Pseudomonas aeruginosa]
MEERDAHLFAEMSKRKRAILGLDWAVEPPRNASAAEESRCRLLARAIARPGRAGGLAARCVGRHRPRLQLH